MNREMHNVVKELYSSEYRNDVPECCFTINKVRELGKANKLLLMAYAGKISDSDHRRSLVSCEIRNIPSQDIIEHIRCCEGYVDILDMLDDIINPNLCDNIGNPEKYNCFLFTLALMLDKNNPEFSERLINTVPFIRLCLEHEYGYSPNHDNSPSHLGPEEHNVNQSRNEHPYAQQMADLIYCHNNSCYFPIMMHSPNIKLKLSAEDLLEMSSLGANIPSKLMNFCEYFTAVPNYQEVFKSMLQNKLLRKHIGRVDLLFEIETALIYSRDFENLGRGNVTAYLKAYRIDDNRSCGHFIDPLSTYDTDSPQREICEIILKSSPHAFRPESINEQDLFDTLCEFANYELPVYWDRQPVILRKNIRAKSARK